MTRGLVTPAPSRVDGSRRDTSAPRPQRKPTPPQRGGLPWSKASASLAGTIGLVLLVVLAFALAMKLKTALEEEIAVRLRASAKLVLLAMTEFETARFADPDLTTRLEEIRTLVPVTAIALYDWRGRMIAQSAESGSPDAWPNQIRVNDR
ncbi:MAG TPA: hypothetical protein VFR10_07685, partial [bacterium]|nr:hypothetical protein [bacterium]